MYLYVLYFKYERVLVEMSFSFCDLESGICFSTDPPSQKHAHMAIDPLNLGVRGRLLVSNRHLSKKATGEVSASTIPHSRGGGMGGVHSVLICL